MISFQHRYAILYTVTISTPLRSTPLRNMRNGVERNGVEIFLLKEGSRVDKQPINAHFIIQCIVRVRQSMSQN